MSQAVSQADAINFNAPRVYVRHVRMAGFCLIPGARDWFTHHGLDWRDFLRHGIAASALEGIRDGLMDKVLWHARNDGNENGGAA